MQDYKSSRCIFNPVNVLTVIDRLTDYILTWLRLLQLLRAPEDELVDAEVLAVDPGAALARLVLVQEPEVPALVLHVTSLWHVTSPALRVARARVPHVYRQRRRLRGHRDVSSAGLRGPAEPGDLRYLNISM